MFHTVSGNLFDAQVDVWVNPVNCEGVMGKGIAKQFKERFPAMFKDYQAYCRTGLLEPGGVHTWLNVSSAEAHPTYIFNLATKDRWRNVSRWEWIHTGLDTTMALMNVWELHTVAMPALGCGEGRLSWPEVQSAIYGMMAYPCSYLNIEVYLYQPLDYVSPFALQSN